MDQWSIPDHTALCHNDTEMLGTGQCIIRAPPAAAAPPSIRDWAESSILSATSSKHCRNRVYCCLSCCSGGLLDGCAVPLCWCCNFSPHSASYSFIIVPQIWADMPTITSLLAVRAYDRYVCNSQCTWQRSAAIESPVDCYPGKSITSQCFLKVWKRSMNVSSISYFYIHIHIFLHIILALWDGWSRWLTSEMTIWRNAKTIFFYWKWALATKNHH